MKNQEDLALEKYQKKAIPYLHDSSMLSDLLDQVQGYIGKVIQRRFIGIDQLLQEIPIFLRMARAWSCHSYRGISYSNMLMVIAGLLYFLSPFDLVPDFFGVFGLMDDLAILGIVASRLHTEIVKFQTWEKERLDG